MTRRGGGGVGMGGDACVALCRDYFIDESNNTQRWDGRGRLRRPVREGVSLIGD